MDLERMLLKGAMTIAGLIAVSIGANGLTELFKERSNQAAQSALEKKKLAEQAQEEARRLDDYFELLRRQETERRSSAEMNDRRNGNES